MVLIAFVIGLITRTAFTLMQDVVDRVTDEENVGVFFAAVLFFLFWDMPIFVMYCFHFKNFSTIEPD